jgi:hypothetical protein
LIQPLAARLFLLGIMATGAFASPTFYDITFTTTSGPAPTSGSFTYDPSAPLASRFTGFTVIWDGGIFDMTDVANTGEAFVGTNCGTTPSSASVFMFLSGQNVCANTAAIAWDGDRSTGIVMFDFRDQELSGPGAPMASIANHASTPYSDGSNATGSFSIASPSSAPEPGSFLLLLMPTAYLLRKRVC